MKKPAVFFTFVSDSYYIPIGTPKLINSFKRFHPDTDLVVFRQDVVDAMFQRYGINWFNAKPYFARLLTDEYDLVVNIDADTIILDRLDEVLDGDYEVGTVTNFNDYENRSVENVTEEQFLQAGLVASRNPEFWDIWADANNNAWKYVCAENDILSLIWYNDPRVVAMNRTIFDKEKNYLGCKSLGREGEFTIEDNKVMCRGEQVKAYHHAKGGGALPKLQFDNMGFSEEVTRFMKHISEYGTTQKFGDI